MSLIIDVMSFLPTSYVSLQFNSVSSAKDITVTAVAVGAIMELEVPVAMAFTLEAKRRIYRQLKQGKWRSINGLK